MCSTDFLYLNYCLCDRQISGESIIIEIKLNQIETYKKFRSYLSFVENKWSYERNFRETNRFWWRSSNFDAPKDRLSRKTLQSPGELRNLLRKKITNYERFISGVHSRNTRLEAVSKHRKRVQGLYARIYRKATTKV